MMSYEHIRQDKFAPFQGVFDSIHTLREARRCPDASWFTVADVEVLLR